MATTSCRFHIIQMAKAGTGVRTILQRLNRAHSAWQQHLQAWATPGALPLDRVGNNPNFETYTFG
jgi:hypothetical protein